MIVGDTLRADRLGSYGNTRGLTPFIDSLAARGYVFRNAYAACSWTNPSVASVFTSRYPSQHGVITLRVGALRRPRSRWRRRSPRRGYATGFFSANGLIREDWGYGQGFSDVHRIRHPGQRPAQPRLSLDPVSRRLHQRRRARLARLRCSPTALASSASSCTSSTWSRTAPTRRSRGAGADRRRDGAARSHEGEPLRLPRPTTVPVDDRVLRDLQDVYDAEVLSLDTGCAPCSQRSHRAGLLDNAIVVVTSDHGEEFKEHGLIGHEKTLFGEVTRVPLLIALPGSRRGGGGDGRGLAGRPGAHPFEPDRSLPPSASFEGRALFPLSSEAAPPGRLAYSELIVPEAGGWKRLSPHPRSVVVGSTADRGRPGRDGILRPEGGSRRAQSGGAERAGPRRLAPGPRRDPSTRGARRRPAGDQADRRRHARADPRARLRPLSAAISSPRGPVGL